MNTGEIILLVLGVIIIVLAVRGKPLWNNWAKPLWNRCRALGMDGIYALVAVLFIWGILFLYDYRLYMNVLIGIMVVALMLAVLIMDNRSS